MPPCAIAAVLLAVSASCAVRGAPQIVALPSPPCAAAGNAVEWFGPADATDRRALSRSCELVGPAVVRSPARSRLADSDVSRAGLVVVTWNMHEGRGNLARLLEPLAPAHVIVLAQEAVRGESVDIAATADQLGLWIAYAPSMPNRRTEERGCAILSTLPLTAPAAIELPWVRQRRVAVAATVVARSGSRSQPLRAVSVHLDNRTGRREQAQALAAWLGSFAPAGAPVIVGGDLNSWFGEGEQTVQAIDRVVPLVESCSGRPSFRFGLRLDHLFAAPSAGAVECKVAADTFGSDHHPVIGVFEPG